MSDSPKVYRLKHPVTLAGTTITELTFRPARAKDFRGIPAKEELITMGHFLDIAAKLAEQPPSVIDQMHPEDVGDVVEIVAGFFGVSPPTGA